MIQTCTGHTCGEERYLYDLGALHLRWGRFLRYALSRVHTGALLETSNAAIFRGIARLLLFLAPRRDLHLDVAAHIAHHAPSALVFACPPPPALSDASSPLILYIYLS